MPIIREQILAAAADLLVGGGCEAVSTRAVCTAADIQAPTLYRPFGDKEGLLDALASYGFQDYLADKQALLGHGKDLIADLRRAWDLHIDFGLSKPAWCTPTRWEPSCPSWRHRRPNATRNCRRWRSNTCCGRSAPATRPPRRER
ncbi:TetR/AcrR family transcriptional regulator [Nonomuraea sp. B12E4]|uniref:TetR/AcrR family transcriptional regulator n=1 Tax=Nonomuraea sp. B12E4 TaxID=3153564 RepID=UPI00325EDA45